MALVVDVLFTIVEAGVVAALDAAVELASRAPLNGRVLEQLGGGWVGEEALAIAVACVLAEPDRTRRCCWSSTIRGIPTRPER